jgi:hypothetical protein
MAASRPSSRAAARRPLARPRTPCPARRRPLPRCSPRPFSSSRSRRLSRGACRARSPGGGGGGGAICARAHGDAGGAEAGDGPPRVAEQERGKLGHAGHTEGVQVRGRNHQDAVHRAGQPVPRGDEVQSGRRARLLRHVRRDGHRDEAHLAAARGRADPLLQLPGPGQHGLAAALARREAAGRAGAGAQQRLDRRPAARAAAVRGAEREHPPDKPLPCGRLRQRRGHRSGLRAAVGRRPALRRQPAVRGRRQRVPVPRPAAHGHSTLR